MRIEIVDASNLAPDPAALTDAERTVLQTLRGERRRIEWIRGRIVLHGVLGPTTSVVVEPDGAPSVIGAAVHVSLSHDGDWIAVAIADQSTRIGIDLCLRAHAARAASVLSSGRFAIASPGLPGRAALPKGVRRSIGAVDPVHAWAAIEAVLKVRRTAVTAVLDGGIVVAPLAGALEVRGIGAPLLATLREEPDFVVACATEPA